MLELKDFMPINFLKKEKFTGSHKGMRFQMEKVETEGEEKPKLGVTVWPEPYGYDATPDSEKEKVLFDFNADGLRPRPGAGRPPVCDKNLTFNILLKIIGVLFFFYNLLTKT